MFLIHSCHADAILIKVVSTLAAPEGAPHDTELVGAIFTGAAQFRTGFKMIRYQIRREGALGHEADCSGKLGPADTTCKYLPCNLYVHIDTRVPSKLLTGRSRSIPLHEC